jgi:hypothetical protein
MEMDMERNTKIIRKMKGIPGGRGLRFPIRDKQMNVIGYMRGFDEHHLHDDDLIETMARARTAFKDFFLTQFEVTPANKKNWLKHSVLENDNKILFLIETLNGEIVGQDGITLLGDGMFMIDGTMRWERKGHAAIFGRNVFERASLGFILLRQDLCKIDVLKKNIQAILNVKSNGFIKRREFAMSKKESGNVTTLSREYDQTQVNTDEVLLEYYLHKQEFLNQNSSIFDNPCWKDVIIE